VNETEQSRLHSIIGRMWSESRQSIFFARRLASMFGASTMTLEHLLLAICRSDSAISTWLGHDEAQVVGLLQNTSAMHILGAERMQRISDALKLVSSGAAPIPTSSDMPLDEEFKSALLRSSEEADAMSSDEVLDVHLLLGILGGKSVAAKALIEAGVTEKELRMGAGGEA